MRRLLLGCVLLLGCGSRVVYEPCPMPDAGDVADAGTNAPHAEPGVIPSVQACQLLENATGDLGCAVLCPWRAISGPGVPREECTPSAVLACVELLGTVNDCSRVDDVLRDCDPDACIEVP